MIKKIVYASVLLAMVQAHAATPLTPQISVSSLAATGGNVTATSPTAGSEARSDYNQWNDASVTTIGSHSEVITVPTTTVAGLAYDYRDVTTSYNSHLTTWKYDYLSVYTVADAGQYSGGKTVLVEGDITSQVNTTLSLTLHTQGDFQTSSSPFGPAIPALPTFYISTGGSAFSPASYGSSSVDMTALYYSADTAGYSITIAAGETIHFKGGVYAGNDVSIESVLLAFRTTPYDVQTSSATHSSTISTLVGAHVLPPVPEPETYAMLIAGLGMLALRRSRRKDVKLS
jgi:hypothetical protein